MFIPNLLFMKSVNQLKIKDFKGLTHLNTKATKLQDNVYDHLKTIVFWSTYTDTDANNLKI